MDCEKLINSFQKKKKEYVTRLLMGQSFVLTIR